MTINSGMTSDVWKCLIDFLYTGALYLTTHLCGDFFELAEQLGMKDLLREVDSHLARFDRPARLPKKPRAFDDDGEEDDENFRPGLPVEPTPRMKYRKQKMAKRKRFRGRGPKRVIPS